jgi:two-component system sensor kinase FixL
MSEDLAHRIDVLQKRAVALKSGTAWRSENEMEEIVAEVRAVVEQLRETQHQLVESRKETELGESWLRSLVNTTQDAVVSIDREGRIVLFNPAAERIFGYTIEEIHGAKVNILMPMPYAAEHDSYIERYEKTGEAHSIGRIRTVEARRKDGGIFPIELSVAEVEKDDKVHYAAFIRDISEKTRLQELLIEKERLAMAGTVASGMAHEIGNPLNGMYMMVQMLERKLVEQNSGENIVARVSTIRDEIRRLTDILGDFRSLARRETYNFMPTALAALCSEIMLLAEQELKEARVQVESMFADDLPHVPADRDKLKQALVNLCKNAIEAMPNGGTLRLGGYPLEDRAVLEIADTGVGIKAGIDVFAPFVTTKAKGTGLGLMLTRKIVLDHGGTIAYTSEFGRGTIFKISLPLTRTSP